MQFLAVAGLELCNWWAATQLLMFPVVGSGFFIKIQKLIPKKIQELYQIVIHISPKDEKQQDGGQKHVIEFVSH